MIFVPGGVSYEIKASYTGVSYIYTSCTNVGESVTLWHMVAWWRHQMETFSALLAICAGNSPHKGQWRGAIMFSLIYARINGWVNTGEAGDLRRHHAHYDVIVMFFSEIYS